MKCIDVSILRDAGMGLAEGMHREPGQATFTMEARAEEWSQKNLMPAGISPYQCFLGYQDTMPSICAKDLASEPPGPSAIS